MLCTSVSAVGDMIPPQAIDVHDCMPLVMCLLEHMMVNVVWSLTALSFDIQ